jgi:hypothetical protein
MTLIQQFPDVTMKARLLHRKNAKQNVSTKEHDDESNNRASELYYESEFRKWHYKLALIIVTIITCMLAALIGLAKLF